MQIVTPEKKKRSPPTRLFLVYFCVLCLYILLFSSNSTTGFFSETSQSVPAISPRYLINTFSTPTEGIGSALASYNLGLLTALLLNLTLVHVPMTIAHGVSAKEMEDFFGLGICDSIIETCCDPYVVSLESIQQSILNDTIPIHYIGAEKETLLDLDNILPEIFTPPQKLTHIHQPLASLGADLVKRLNLSNNFYTGALEPRLFAAYLQRDLHTNFQTGLNFHYTQAWFKQRYNNARSKQGWLAPIFQHKDPFLQQVRENSSKRIIIAIHHRAGDVRPGSSRFRSLESTEILVEQIFSVGVLVEQSCEIFVFSEMTPGLEQDFAKFRQRFNLSPPHVDTKLIIGTGTSALSDFAHLVSADILICGRSSYSHLAAMYSRGVVFSEYDWQFDTESQILFALGDSERVVPVRVEEDNSEMIRFRLWFDGDVFRKAWSEYIMKESQILLPQA
jgi:hypothetical protein